MNGVSEIRNSVFCLFAFNIYLIVFLKKTVKCIDTRHYTLLIFETLGL